MSVSGDGAQSLHGQKTASGASEEIVWDIWKANIKKKKSSMTQNKLDGPQSSNPQKEGKRE